MTGWCTLKRMDKESRILPLTSLRFFAAIFVVFFHTFRFAFPVLSEQTLFGESIKLGFVSVSFFFVLSGYILAIVYLKGNRLTGKRDFWRARFARIYPVFLFTLVLDTPYLLMHRTSEYGWPLALATTFITFLSNCFMLQAWSHQLRGLDFPNWSLAVETVFYLLFPFAGRRLWNLSTRLTALLLPLVYVVGMLVVAACSRWLELEVLQYNPLLHLNEFVAGILLAKLHVSATADSTTAATLERYAPAGALAGMALFAVCIYFRSRIPFNLLHDGLLIPIHAILIVAFASGNRLISLLFSPKWLVLLGEASYGLYLLHLPLWHFYELFALSAKNQWILYPCYIALTIAASVIIYLFFEVPSRRAILNRFKVRTRESEVASGLAQ